MSNSYTTKPSVYYGRTGRLVNAIEKHNDRFSPEERKEKFTIMAESPFSFFRGTNHIFWMDFQWNWLLNRFGNQQTITWLNGDCHPFNFGAFKDKNSGVVYGLNDFDESVIADYQYDLWRLAIGQELMMKDLGGFNKKERKKAAKKLCEAYLDGLEKFAGNRLADEEVLTSENTETPLSKFLNRVRRKESRGEMLEKWTHLEGGTKKFDLRLAKLAPVSAELREQIREAFAQYLDRLPNRESFPERFFDILDIAKRLRAGTGSYGTERYYILLEGNPHSSLDEVILDVKLQTKPAAIPWLPEGIKKPYRIAFPNEGARYVAACKALTFSNDPFLGWMSFQEKAFAVRERNPYKEAFPLKKLDRESTFFEMAESWGYGLAIEHSRADSREEFNLGREVLNLVQDNKKSFIRLVQDISRGYARQVKQDHDIFVRHFT